MADSKKRFISPDELLKLSYGLGEKVIRAGFRPTRVVAFTRGGGPVGIAMHELFKSVNKSGVPISYHQIGVHRYTGIDSTDQDKPVTVLGAEYLIRHLNQWDNLLLVDDIYDRGHTVCDTITFLKKEMRSNFPDNVRVATVFFKPKRNETTRIPEFSMEETNEWIEFPHELEELTLEEIALHKGVEIAAIVAKAHQASVSNDWNTAPLRLQPQTFSPPSLGTAGPLVMRPYPPHAVTSELEEASGSGDDS
jgi:hypoxanthine phosphoribosyltransferase